MKKPKLNRRSFLRNTSLSFLWAGLLGKTGFATPSQDQENELPKIKEYRTLGRTGFKVSDIGCGPIIISHENVLQTLIKCGLNYIDTAEQYGNGNNERMVGKVINKFNRKSLFITTKLIIEEGETSNNILLRARKCLERLQTDYIDCLMMHDALSSKEVKNPKFHEAIDQLKNEGRLKYCGISCHGQSWYDNPKETMNDILKTAISDGRYDVFLFIYNFIEQEMGQRILKLCQEKNIGTTLMKTDPFGGFFLKQLERYEYYMNEGKEIPSSIQTIYEKFIEKQKKAAPFIEKYQLNNSNALRDSAIRFVLSNQDVNSVMISFKNFSDVTDYLNLSGTRLFESDIVLLEGVKNTFRNLHCRIGCNICESECPHHVPVNTIMRYNYYFTSKGQEKYAMQKYKELPGGKPDLCFNCEGFCEEACPYGVLTRPLLAMAHQNLSLKSPIYT